MSYKPSATDVLQGQLLKFTPKVRTWADLDLTEAAGQIVANLYLGVAVPVECMLSLDNPLELAGFVDDKGLVAPALVDVTKEGYLSLTDKGQMVIQFAQDMKIWQPPKTLEYKHFSSDIWGYELPVQIKPTKEFLVLLKWVGWKYFAYEIHEPRFVEDEDGNIFLTRNKAKVTQKMEQAGLTEAAYELPL